MFTTNTILEMTTQMLVNGSIDKSLTYIHTFKYYPVININGLELYVSTWTNLKNMILREKNKLYNVLY